MALLKLLSNFQERDECAVYRLPAQKISSMNQFGCTTTTAAAVRMYE